MFSFRADILLRFSVVIFKLSNIIDVGYGYFTVHYFA